ncbi:MULTISPECIES: DUF4153 domain-containing protein [Caloramator]|uniref:DUF4153 domain-containing protein n=1 Tax=Caloramator australicus RC3 TaxID=857293 RepID=I7LGP2_9CLOT|nr:MULTISPECIES: DUF4153 domain-containing protein [Caloramator]MDO6355976.1 DUF4153 domain-containing protein [Caloramator sp. CAR-1]CCJ33410.1 FIG00529231: hypothetical protein [Caloramator australicus RC3]
MGISKVFKGIINSIYRAINRFPITIALSTMIAALLIAMIEIESRNLGVNTNNLKKLAMTLALGMAISLFIKLWTEREQNKSREIFYYALDLIFMVAYYFTIKDFKMVTMSRFFALNLIFYLIFLFIPYFPKRKNFEMYVIKVLSSFFTTVLYSLVLFFGISAILFTIDRLLEVRIKEQMYLYSFILVVFVFAVTYFLANIPQYFEEFTKENFTKLLKILILYIVMPLLSVYTAILYIYFVKIILTRTFPQGIVSHLVLWYSLIVAAVLFFITPIHEDNKWAKIFLMITPKAILPILVMMFISIGIRIQQYGVTENRYYVVIAGIWVFLIMLYFAFTKSLLNIILPVSLSIFILISNFGPLSSFSISKFSQNKRLENILIRNELLKDGKIVPKSYVNHKDKENISSILSYFERYHSLDDVKYLPKGFQISDMKKVFGFEYTPKVFQPVMYFNFQRKADERSLNISGYDYLFDMRYMYENTEAKGIYAKYDYNSSVLKIFNGNEEIYSKDLDEFVKKLVIKYKDSGQELIMLGTEDLTFTDVTPKVKVKIIFNSITVQRDFIEKENSEVTGKGYEFYVLIK